MVTHPCRVLSRFCPCIREQLPYVATTPPSSIMVTGAAQLCVVHSPSYCKDQQVLKAMAIGQYHTMPSTKLLACLKAIMYN